MENLVLLLFVFISTLCNASCSSSKKIDKNHVQELDKYEDQLQKKDYLYCDGDTISKEDTGIFELSFIKCLCESGSYKQLEFIISLDNPRIFSRYIELSCPLRGEDIFNILLERLRRTNCIEDQDGELNRPEGIIYVQTIKEMIESVNGLESMSYFEDLDEKCAEDNQEDLVKHLSSNDMCKYFSIGNLYYYENLKRQYDLGEIVLKNND